MSYAEAVEHIEVLGAELERLAGRRPMVLKGSNTAGWVLHFLASQQAGLLVVCMPQQSSEAQLERISCLLGSTLRVDGSHGSAIVYDVGSKTPVYPAGASICLPTSGSTGAPRLALRSAASLLAEGERYRALLRMEADDSILAAMPIGHAFCLGLALGGALAAACTLRLLPRFAPRSLARELRQRPPSVLPLVPSAARLLCAAWGQEPALSVKPRHVVVGAGAVSDALEGHIVRCLGRRPARNYGSSETGATLGTSGEEVAAGTTGKPLPGIEAQISNAGRGMPGALFVRSVSPFIGYLTADGFDGSCTTPDGWYSTGDLCIEQDAEYLSIVGRLGRSLRRGGRTIQPLEVEEALRQHPAVVDAAIVGSKDPHGEDVVEAHVELATTAQVGSADLHAFLDSRLESYKLPTSWRFVAALPRTEAGKLDVAQLAQPSTVAGQRLFPWLACHRLSAALTVAHRVGILDALGQGKGMASSLAEQLELDLRGVEILLSVLCGAGVVHRGIDGVYELAENLGSGIGDMVDLEDQLKANYLNADRIEPWVRGGLQRQGAGLSPSDDFHRLYLRVMSHGGRRIALHAWRRLSLVGGPILDVGRPAGLFAEIVGRFDAERSIGIQQIGLERAPRVQESQKPLAALFLHNVFRYLQTPEGRPFLDEVFRWLRPGGVLVVSDIFVDAPAPQPWLRQALALDWASFGSTSWPRGDALCERLQQLGFRDIERYRTDSMFDLITAIRRNKTKEIDS